MKSMNKIAIVKLSAMGDIVHAMVALQFIKKVNPSIKIDWFVEEVFKGVLENNSHIDNIYTVNLKKIKKDKSLLFKEISRLRNFSKNNYDLVIDAQGLLKSAVVSKLLGKNIAGFSKNSIREKVASYFYKQKVEIAYDKNTIDRNVKVLCEPFGIKVSSEEIINKEPFLFYSVDESIENLLDKDKKNIVFVISSTWESRNYPKEKFVQIANTLKQNCIVIWGNEEEKQKALYIENNSEYARTYESRLDFNALKYLISRCDLLIGNDTGPTHMAWGLNIPSLTIFGNTPVNRVYQTPINKVIKSSSKVNHYKLDKNDFSIREIEVGDIVKIALDLLEDKEKNAK